MAARILNELQFRLKAVAAAKKAALARERSVSEMYLNVGEQWQRLAEIEATQYPFIGQDDPRY